MAKRATVEDIAKYCGVSSATVSRVVNHRELVKPQTVKLVEDAMLSELHRGIAIILSNHIKKT